jgi:hypothetical protein
MKNHSRKEREKYRGNGVSSLNAFYPISFQRDVHSRLEK